MSKNTVPCVRVVAIISLYLCSLAQAHADGPRNTDSLLRFGGFLGGGFADWMGKDADGTLPGVERVSKPAFSAGLVATLDTGTMLNLQFEPLHLGVQPELVYSTKGTRLARDGELTDASTKMTYLQAALLIRAGYDVSERVTPYLLTGPALGFLRKVEFRNGLGDTLDTKDDYKSTDLGLIVGLGSLFSFPPWGAASLELRADLGLVSIDGQGDGDEIRNAALSLLVGYLY